MKKILFICDCYCCKLVLKFLLERKKDCKVTFVSLGLLSARDLSQATVLIHLSESPLPESFMFFEKNKKSKIKSSKKNFLSGSLDAGIRFIDVQSIFDGWSNDEVFEESIESICGFSEINEKIDLLSTREFLVLSMLLTGLSLTTIAYRTKRSIKTISTQKVSALKKLDLDNTTHSLLKLSHDFRFCRNLRFGETMPHKSR